MRKKKVRIVYDPALELEKRASFVSTKIGTKISQVKKTIENIPGGGKWLIALFIGAFLSTMIQIVLMSYFNMGFDTFEEIDLALRIQFLVDAIIIGMMSVFIGLLIRETRS